MKCAVCGAENIPDSRLCKACGHLLSGEKGGSISSAETVDHTSPFLQRGLLFAGRYEIIEVLGTGGMGVVYRVHDTKIDDEITLKVLKPGIASEKKTIERFRNELRLARKISHKNVCRMFDLNEGQDSIYITMEYIAGQDLRGLIRQAGRLTIQKAVSIAIQLAKGLSEAHRAGIIHRDLKPGNVMIDKEGNAKILDFGIARSLETKGLTGVGTLIGTPEYMAPEQVDGISPDKRTDIYSMGIMLFEMLTGRLPFEGDTPVSIAIKHKTEIPPEPLSINPGLPGRLNRLILKCLEKDKSRRFQTMEELIAELQAVLNSLPHSDLSGGGKRFRTRKLVRSRLRIPAYVIFGAVFVLFIYWMFLSSPKKGDVLDSVAVLPIANIENNQDTEYLCDGITESLISRLSQLPSFTKVIAGSSVFSYKGRTVDPQEAGKELAVDAVLVGRLRRQEDDLVLSVELVKVADKSRIWGGTYNKKMSEIFELQESISSSIVESLRMNISGDEMLRLTKRSTTKWEAFEAYSRGIYFWGRRGEHLITAIEHFKKAVAIDPNYALAYTGLAKSYFLLPEYVKVSPDEAFPLAEEAVSKAMELDPQLAEVYITTAQIRRRIYFDWDGAAEAYRRAIYLNPGFATAYHWYAYDLMCRERFAEAIGMMERAYELDPLSLVINRNLGQVYYRAGRYEDGLSALRRGLELDPKLPAAHYHMAMAHVSKGRLDDALKELEAELEATKALEFSAKSLLGIIKVWMGQRSEAEIILRDLVEASEATYVSPTCVAGLYMVLGDHLQGFSWLEKAIEGHDVRLSWLRIDPAFSDVRSDPRFQIVLERIGLQ